MKSNFALLLPVIALLAAFTLPPASGRARQVVQDVFRPVSWPANKVGLAIDSAMRSPGPIDPHAVDAPQTLDQALAQNAALRVQIENLSAQLEDLKKLSYQYEQLGATLRSQVQGASVTAGPTDQRQAITISTAGFTKAVAEGAPVLTVHGLVGRVQSVGVGSARVMLITDPASRLEGNFVRYHKREDGRLEAITIGLDNVKPMAAGTGRGLVTLPIPAATVRDKVNVGDVFVLDDPRVPQPGLRGYRLGMVTKVNLPPTNAGHATVEVEPSIDFKSLRDVMVMK